MNYSPPKQRGVLNYDYINQDKTSQVFVYEGVQFWREDFQFVFSFKEKRFVGGDIVPFEEFLEMLRGQKE